MNVPVVIMPQADAEVFDIFLVYRAVEPSLGGRFVNLFEKTVASIQEFPEACSKVFKHSRRIRMKKFPYHVY